MMAPALLSLLLGWTLGQIFKVLVLVPAGVLAIVLVLALSISVDDSPLQIALKILVINFALPLGYAFGQTVFYIPGILRRTRKSGGGMTGLHPRHR